MADDADALPRLESQRGGGHRLQKRRRRVLVVGAGARCGDGATERAGDQPLCPPERQRDQHPITSPERQMPLVMEPFAAFALIRR
jgi:hypothetical protein